MTEKAPKTSATGGSADSQADTLDERSWQPRRGISLAIRAALILVPPAASFVAVWAVMVIVERPSALPVVAAWLVMLFAVAIAASRSAGFATRRLAPLAALFKMSLVFPDAAPSRFRTALRTGTGRQLAGDADAQVLSHQEAAEHLVALLGRLSAHDRLTRGHSERVRAYAVMLGEEMGLDDDELVKLNWAALAHDIGKLHVPESVLNKNGRPTEDEWEVLKNHPAAAEAHIAALRPWLGDWVDCATQHHERYDGTGYPHGLAGEEISLSGRIVSIADAFDVMTATRSYKRALPSAQARAELLRNAGTQFDPRLVRTFLQISIPEQRRGLGWLGWLSHVPAMIRVPGTVAVPSLPAVVTAGTVALATVIGPPDVDFRPPELDLAIERNIDDDPTPTEPVARPVPSTTPVPTTTLLPTDPTTPTVPPTTLDTSLPVNGTAPPTTAALDPPRITTIDDTLPTTTIISTTTITTSTTTTTTTTSTTTTPPLTVANDDAQLIVLLVGRTIAVLDNDDFGESSADLATLEVIVDPTKGSTSVIGDSIRYTPDLFANGADSFTYRICSVAGSCDAAEVAVTIAL